ncbi:MAG TPA: hypothetical protein VGL95_01280 [Acetobacteraceae bacterium]
MRADPGADDTVRLVPSRAAPPRPRAAWQFLAAGAVSAALAMGIVGWVVWPRQAPVRLSVPQPVPAQQQPAGEQYAAPAQRSIPAPRPVPAQQGPVQQIPTQSLLAQPVPAQPLPAPSAPPQPVSPQPALAQPAPSEQAPRAALPSPPALAPAAPLVPASPAPAPLPIEAADEAEIRAHVSTGLTVFRFAANPSIVVLDFASLHQQGRMLNRIAALIEKAAMPRDRVLNDTELDAAISAGGDTVETFYYGHDYSATALAGFYSLAARQGVTLNPEEKQLHRLLAQLGWLAPDVHGGLISLPKVGANAEVNPAARKAILRHELSHGEYFSNPAYAAYVHQFWVHDLTQMEQDGIRKFLAADEYDPKIEELVENEMQAYLMFTRDPLFFTPAKIGMTPERLADLQVAFHRNMPRGWLRDLLGQTMVVAASPY